MVERAKTATADLKVRVKEPLRALVEAAALERGVSMNAEFVDRLKMSFGQDNELENAFGSKDLLALMRAIASAMNNAGNIATSLTRHPSTEHHVSWWSDPYAFDQAAKAARYVIEAFRPTGDPSPPPIQPAYIAKADATALSDALNSMGTQSARTFIKAVLRGREVLIDDLLSASLRSRIKHFSIGDQLHLPIDAADDTEGGKHEGQHHSPRQVQLAPKVRSRRAQRRNR
jgi:hypothetical protein